MKFAAVFIPFSAAIGRRRCLSRASAARPQRGRGPDRGVVCAMAVARALTGESGRSIYENADMADGLRVI